MSLDERARRYQRARWFGAKKYAKALLGLRPLNALGRAALRALALGQRCSGFPVNLPEVEGLAGDSRFALLRPMRCSIARELYWGGGRRLRREERFALELFCGLARESAVVLDIGAHTGLFS